MEKIKTPERLLDTGLELLGTVGARRFSARAVEDATGLPHGSVRHHFGSQAGLLEALVTHLLALDVPREGEAPQQVIARWLGPDRVHTQARYELVLASLHDQSLQRHMVAARDRFVEMLVENGAQRDRAHLVVAAIDGVVLDAVLRGESNADPRGLFVNLGEALHEWIDVREVMSDGPQSD